MSELKLPHRVTQHEIDNEACKIVISKFDRNWEIRDLTGRDFGIDKIVERFQDGYATSELLLLQIKGTENEIDINNPRFSLDTKELQYAEMFTTPFLLVYVSITNPQQCYYVWLQEYIRVRLQLDKPNWREQDTNTIYFPKENILNLNERMDHILYITKFPKFEHSWVQYYLALDDIDFNLPNMFIYENMTFEDVWYTIKNTEETLKNALLCSDNIPDRLIPNLFDETISLIEKIKDTKEKPTKNEYIRIISNISEIKSSMQSIALRFDYGHLRFLYESEGIADY